MISDGPTYAEARMWIRWLNIFTPSDLADAMAVHQEVASRFVKAALWHGIIEDSGDSINGSGPREQIYHYKPLPPGPKVHATMTPEWLATPGCYAEAPARGLPVRLVDNTQRRNLMQGTGGARLRVKNRDRAWERMQQAKMDRSERDRQKARAKSMGMQRAADAMRRADEFIQDGAFKTSGNKHAAELPHKDKSHTKKTQRKTK